MRFFLKFIYNSQLYMYNKKGEGKIKEINQDYPLFCYWHDASKWCCPYLQYNIKD